MLRDALVLDLTRYLPGPYATQLLGDLGAEVIKVERPGDGDPLRSWAPLDGDGVSAAFRALNRGKRSIALDLRRPEGKEVFLRLVDGADVLVESFRPGVLARLGVGPRECRARNPRLVFCSISGFGQDGPYRDRPGHDVTYLAYSGALSITVDRGHAPVVPGMQVGDTVGAFSAVVGVLAALLERERTGAGRDVDASMLDSLVSMQSLQLVPHLAGARAEPGHRPLSGGYPCYGVYATADGGAVALGALEPKFWEAFCTAVEHPDWIARQHDESLRPELERLFAEHARDEWRARLEDVECCLAPVLRYDEIADDPQVRARELIRGDRLAPPVRLSPPVGPPPTERSFPARVGEHTREVLQELLGLEPAEVEALAARGAIALPGPGNP